MKPMNYRHLSSDVMQRLQDEYISIFRPYLCDKNVEGKLQKGMETKWSDWKAVNDPNCTINETVEQLLTLDYQRLVDIYFRFKALKIPLMVSGTTGKRKNPILEDLDKVFSYSGTFDGKIAQFFYDWAQKLKIHTCYYCDMAYINTYQYLDNNGTLQKKRQFDLDHFLPKSVCPCVALSLFNFVPSCQVCNSRIKGVDIPTYDAKELELLSPSSTEVDFDSNITIKLRFRPKHDRLLGDQYIYFRSNPPYNKYVNFFHLEERYNFHKPEAKRLKELKMRYPDSSVRAISRLLNRKESLVKEDIFHLKYLKREGRCFEKLTRDMLS